MFRYSFLVLAIASALMLNGCSQCSNNQQETAPAAQEAAPEAPPAEAAPAEAAPADPAAAPAEEAPADGAAAPAEGTPAQ